MFTRPPVYALADDVPKLKVLAGTAGTNAPGAALFAEEFDRLCVLSHGGKEPFVRPGSSLTYLDLRTKQESRVRLSHPADADQTVGDVSLLSPLGAALIGLMEGAIFRWTDVDGRLRAVKVISIEA